MTELATTTELKAPESYFNMAEINTGLKSQEEQVRTRAEMKKLVVLTMGDVPPAEGVVIWSPVGPLSDRDYLIEEAATMVKTGQAVLEITNGGTAGQGVAWREKYGWSMEKSNTIKEGAIIYAITETKKKQAKDSTIPDFNPKDEHQVKQAVDEFTKKIKVWEGTSTWVKKFSEHEGLSPLFNVAWTDIPGTNNPSEHQALLDWLSKYREYVSWITQLSPNQRQLYGRLGSVQKNDNQDGQLLYENQKKERQILEKLLQDFNDFKADPKNNENNDPIRLCIVAGPHQEPRQIAGFIKLLKESALADKVEVYSTYVPVPEDGWAQEVTTNQSKSETREQNVTQEMQRIYDYGEGKVKKGDPSDMAKIEEIEEYLVQRSGSDAISKIEANFTQRYASDLGFKKAADLMFEAIEKEIKM